MIVCNTVKTRQNINKGRIGSLEWKTTATSRLDGFQPVLCLLISKLNTKEYE